MQLDVIDGKNKKIENIEVNDAIFNTKWNASLVHQVITAILANKRKPWAHTKTRGDVRGGGKKPWKQKHTGRARVSSTRSPLWAHGGVALGPRNERDYTQKVNKKMRERALFAILSKKLKNKELQVISELSFKNSKTKEAATVLTTILKSKNASALIIAKSGNDGARRAVRNIPKKETTTPSELNVYDCAKHKFIIFEKEAVRELENKYTK